MKRLAFASRLLGGLVALGVSLGPGASHARPQRPAKPSSDSSGRVVFVTSEHAYLDRGRANGLPVDRGDTLVLMRGKIRTRCQVSFAGGNTATWVGEGAPGADR